MMRREILEWTLGHCHSIMCQRESQCHLCLWSRVSWEYTHLKQGLQWKYCVDDIFLSIGKDIVMSFIKCEKYCVFIVMYSVYNYFSEFEIACNFSHLHINEINCYILLNLKLNDGFYCYLGYLICDGNVFII